MGIEVISQVLSPTNATYVNGVSAERKVSEAVLKNYFQGLVERKGKGVSDRFVLDSDAEEAAQVFVNRIIPTKTRVRTLGTSKNGGSFSSSNAYTTTETVGIDILFILDEPIVIPRATQAMIKTNILAEQTEIFSNKLNTVINGMTFGGKVMKTLLATDRNEIKISDADIAAKTVSTRFIEANTKLDHGDQEHGIDVFPMDTRVAVFKVDFRPLLIGQGILTIGGANYAYDILKSGAVDAQSVRDQIGSGFAGVVDEVEVHLISDASLIQAEEFMGLPFGEINKADLYGYISSSYANARGVSQAQIFKIVDAQEGQGVKLQPFVKMGFECWYPKGNCLIEKDTFINVFERVKALWTGSTISLKLKGGASRLYPTITIANPVAASFTATANALDDFSNDHVNTKLYYAQTDTAISTVTEFLRAYDKSGAIKGNVTSGTQKTSAGLTTGKYLSVYAISDDGSMTVKSALIG